MSPDQAAKFRELFWLFVEADWSVSDIAEGFGMSSARVVCLLGERPGVNRRTAPRAWCGQCDRRITATDATLCSSPFCKAKAKAA